MGRRVVITGIGIWSCIGRNVDEVERSLREGRSGIGVEQARLDYGYQSGLTGIVERPVLKGLLDRRTRAVLGVALICVAVYVAIAAISWIRSGRED